MPTRFRIRLLTLAASGSLIVAGPSTAQVTQDSPYRNLTDRRIKALSADEATAYRRGDGMRLALAAELNGYPGPRHVLDYADTLGLHPDQRASVRRVFDRMRTRAVRLGTDIVAREGTLDSLFAHGSITPEMLREQVHAIGQLQAELRVVHLAAHLATTDLLSAEQIALYQRVRGYASTSGRSHEHRRQPPGDGGRAR